ncbi:MAG: bifunctional DNA primase/polymerase [Planctomycetes bacterium]|nr:bifunctional DNA primase/polymerase [Planctomycetota bacterium]
MSELLDAALRYAELGYPVFPCASGRKIPLTPSGFHDATTDEAQIDTWWKRWPTANVAIATAGLVVIDVDGPENKWLADDPDRLLELASGCAALTPGGGRHYYFRQPDGDAIRCQTGQLAPRVDVRAEGGYALVPPSVVGGRSYRWVEGLELDQPRERQQPPPTWLVDRLSKVISKDERSRCIANGDSGANPIPSGQRNATLTRLAGTMRRVGMSRTEIGAALERANHDRCSPPISPAEVQRIAESVARYAPDQISVAIAEDHFQQLGAKPKADEPLSFEAITSKELDENDYELQYLINGVLVRGQPGVIAGPKKTLKTNISIDLALSLASGGRFLGHFAADEEVRVGIMSGESGAATIQETARRIAVAKDSRLQDFANVMWSFAVPQLGDAAHIEALHRFIATHNLSVLVLDPTYLMMLGLGDQAGNLFIVGSFLKSLGDLAQSTGCTPLLCHHLKKGVADPYEPAELENIAWAGFQEFVRQWILLNRRVRYDPDRGGQHELWMSVGGSAGHSGLWGLNVEEGTRQDVGGRRWEVDVISAADAYAGRIASASDAADERKEQQRQMKREKQRGAVLDALRRYPDGETPRLIREAAGVGNTVASAILADLLDEGVIEACTVQKNTRQENGFRLVA